MTDRAPVPTVGQLRNALADVSVRDAARLKRRISGTRGVAGADARATRLRRLAEDVAEAAAATARRAATVPTPRYPTELPISARREELLTTLRDHQVVVVAGETGSGKSTQLPKLCLEAGGGVRGLIGHTQPRRIAARAVAERVADELGTRVGDLVGYQVRFTDVTAEQTLIKVMTDGILLNEIQRDPDLLAYDTLIIDEAHERSLNIDFILGYLTRLLPRRPDLTVVITSATIDTQRFAAHFAAADGTPAPVVEVSGRTYPVEVRYRPLADTDADGRTIRERDVVDGICDAIRELTAEGGGDILVFAAGERDIRDAAQAIERMRLRDVEVLPLYSRLSAAEQHRVFSPHAGRRVVIATNIAETSLTVPGIRAVVDPGLARISRWSRRSKVQRLPIEKVAKASADQRAGRCGRVGPGVCIRLFDEDDYAGRPDYTEPEILRTNLAAVILQMSAIGLASDGDGASTRRRGRRGRGRSGVAVSIPAIEAFPFVEAPDRRAITDGVTLLEELGALTTGRGRSAHRRLTDLGARLARIPVDPQLARMVLAAEEERCVHEVLVIAAGLSIQDPRERPTDQPDRAAALHARFDEPGSDLLAYLNLWEHLRAEQRARSGNQFRRMCRDEHLHYLRIREWQDLHTQLKRVARELGMTISHADDRPPADRADAVHRSVLSGLLSNIGVRDGDSREYLGTRGTRFRLGRRSSLTDNPPAFLVAAEIVETNRLWASAAARIDPAWVEPLAGDLVTRSHGEAYWSARKGAAMTTERVTFRGVPIVTDRRIPYARVDPAAARQMFIRRGLVDGEWRSHHRFLRVNQQRLADARTLEDRARRRGLVAPDEVIHDFYDQRIPADVTGAITFDAWWKGARQQQPHLLDLPEQLLHPDVAEGVDPSAYPDRWAVQGHDLPLSYTFDPDTPEADGVTVAVPLALLPRMDPQALSWHVPGLRHELVTSLIRGLPKPIRRSLIPAPDRARALLARLGPDDGPMLPVLARELSRASGAEVTPAMLAAVPLPPHLRLRYQVTAADGNTVVAASDDLSALQSGLRSHVEQLVTAEARRLERRGLTAFDVEEIPRTVTSTRLGEEATTYPTLSLTEDGRIDLVVVGSAEEQARRMWAGTRALLQAQLPSPLRVLSTGLSDADKLLLTLAPHPDVAAVAADCQAALVDAVLGDEGGPAWTRAAFHSRLAVCRQVQASTLLTVAVIVARTVEQAQAVREELARPGPSGIDVVKREVAVQLGRLVFDGFVLATGAAQLRHLPRYVRGLGVRLELFRRSPSRDAEPAALLADLDAELALARSLPGAGPVSALTDLRWQIEELRVALLAPSLGTARRVSEARIRAALRAFRTGATAVSPSP